MALEALLERLITSNEALTAALLKGGGKPATTAAAGKSETKAAAAPAVSFEDVKTALVKVKTEISPAAAKKIIKDVGKAVELAAIKQPQFAAVIAMCEEVLSDAANQPAEPESDEL